MRRFEVVFEVEGRFPWCQLSGDERLGRLLRAARSDFGLRVIEARQEAAEPGRPIEPRTYRRGEVG